MFVKVCGVTSPTDAAAAADAGADAIGLNFVPTSRRRVDAAAARSILAVVPDHVMLVGIFWEHSADEILEITGALGLDAAQLHGDNTPEFTARVATGVDTVIKVVVADSPSLDALGDHAADIVMVDGPDPGAGVTFDWALVGDLITKSKILLAGGLRPHNVGEAVRRVRPWGVDVATGVEIEPGRKNHEAIVRFVEAARHADNSPSPR